MLCKVVLVSLTNKQSNKTLLLVEANAVLSKIMKTFNLMLAFLVGIITLGMVGCDSATPFIQVNLGPASSGSMRRPMSVMAPPRMMAPHSGGYPAAGGNGGYYGGYQQPYGQSYGYGPSYGHGGGYRQPYTSSNMLMRYGSWIPQWHSSRYFLPHYPSGFMRGNSGCHRPPPPPRCDDRHRRR